MTVADAIRMLRAYPPDLMVVVAKDQEGHWACPLFDRSEGFYAQDKGAPWRAELQAAKTDKAVPCLVLWPAA